MGTILEFDSAGRLTNRKGKVARQVFIFISPWIAVFAGEGVNSAVLTYILLAWNNCNGVGPVQAAASTSQGTRAKCQTRVWQGFVTPVRVRPGSLRSREQGRASDCHPPSYRGVRRVLGDSRQMLIKRYIHRKKSVQIRTDGVPSTRASISALWGPKALENLVDLDIMFTVETERAVLRRRGILDGDTWVRFPSVLPPADRVPQ